MTSVIKLFLRDLFQERNLIWKLAKNDFKTKYAGSLLGIVWAFINPVVTLMVYWIVFEFGLKATAPMEGIPFILWFSSGMVPWFFFSESLQNATNCMIEYNYLVKKIVFRISVLPIVKIISALFIHLVFIGFVMFLFIVYDFGVNKYIIQLPYYLLCTFFLVLGMSYCTSAMIVFFKDLGQIIGIFLQVAMWATPIMWSYTIVPKHLQWIVKLNPMYYIVEGYRDTFINGVWFWQKYNQTALFWTISLGVFIAGVFIYKKLKPHFADVL